MKPAPTSLYVAPDSEARAFAEGIAWLWRLGPLNHEPGTGAVGLGVAADGAALGRLVARGQLAGAIVLAAGSSEDEPLPALTRVTGVADLPEGSVKGTFTTFLEGRPVLRSRLGLHAVERGGVFYLGSSPGDWAAVSTYWLFGLIADVLRAALARPLIVLPPIGCVRLDDVPGTALQQVTNRAHPDRTMVRRIRKLTRRYGCAGARLVVAVSSEAFVDGQPVPLAEVWPESVVALRDGVRAGVLETACHGTLHLDVEAFAEGTIEPREFARLSEDEARRRIQKAAGWLSETIGKPESFVAPAWGYSSGALAAAAASALPAWCEPGPGPLFTGPQLFETTRNSLLGVTRVDYRFLSALARLGVPPTVVFHGRLLDNRRDTFDLPGDAVACLRLAFCPDLFRMPRVSGVRWVGARELVDALRAHDETTLAPDSRSAVGPGSSRVLQ
jgi:hypothetical protein